MKNLILIDLRAVIIAKSESKHTSVPANCFKIFLAKAPGATLPMVSLAEDLPPPLKKILHLQ